MMKWLVVLSFVAGAALSWGVYVPVVHRAAFELKSNLRAFMFVGRGVLRRCRADSGFLHLRGQVRSHCEAWNYPEFSAASITLGSGCGNGWCNGRVMRDLRCNKGWTRSCDLCGASRVWWGSHHQHAGDDLFLPPDEDLARLAFLCRPHSGSRWCVARANLQAHRQATRAITIGCRYFAGRTSPRRRALTSAGNVGELTGRCQSMSGGAANDRAPGERTCTTRWPSDDKEKGLAWDSSHSGNSTLHGARQDQARLVAVRVSTATRNRKDTRCRFADVIIGAPQ
jgi:hypothetical protein